MCHGVTHVLTLVAFLLLFCVLQAVGDMSGFRIALDTGEVRKKTQEFMEQIHTYIHDYVAEYFPGIYIAAHFYRRLCSDLHDPSDQIRSPQDLAS